MRSLLAGMQSEERFKLLLSLTRISSEEVKSALRDHLVLGHPESVAASINGVAQSNFTRALNKVKRVADSVEKIKELDWSHINSVK